MYCIKCGVELADGERSCPLCKTEVYHPVLGDNNGERSYPSERLCENRVSPWGHLFILTLLFLLPIIITPLCDISIHGTISWSAYVIFGVLVAYVCLVLPSWFHRPNPVIFVPSGLSSIALYILFIDLYTGGEHWFLPFALPLLLGVIAIISAAVTLLHYLKRGKLYVYGGTSIATGLLLFCTEFLIVRNFDVPYYGWSVYPLAVLTLLGLALIIIAIIRPLRESLAKRFFIEPPKRS